MKIYLHCLCLGTAFLIQVNYIYGQNLPGGVTPGSGGAPTPTPGGGGSQIGGGNPSGGPSGGKPPKDKVKYSCPKECQGCQYFKDPTKVCMAFDEYGDIKNTTYDAMSNETREHFDFINNSTLFTIKAYAATCDGLRHYLDIWAALGEENRKTFLDFVEDPTSITSEKLQQIVGTALDLFAILKENVENKLYRNMNDDQRLEICKAVKNADCFTRATVSHNVRCARILMRRGAASARDIRSMIDQTNCTNWDDELWNLTLSNSPEVLNIDCLKKAPADAITDNLDSLARHCNRFKRREVDIVAETAVGMIKKEIEQGRQVSIAIRDAVVDFLSRCGADPSLLEGLISKGDMLSKVDLNKGNARAGIKFMNEVLKTVIPRNLKKNQIVNSFKMIAYDKDVLNALNETELAEAVCEICDKADEYPNSDLARLANIVLERIPSLRNPANYTQDTFDCIGPLMKFFPEDSFDEIPTDALKSAFTEGKIKNMTVTSRTMAKKVFDAAKAASGKDFDQFSRADVENLGSAVVALVSKDVNKLPDSVFGEEVINLFATNIKRERNSDNKPSKATISSLMEKVKKTADGVKKAIESGLGDDIPTEVFKDAPLSDLPDITGNSTEVTIEVDEKRAGILISKLKREFGSLNASETRFTVQRLQNIAKIACGLTPQEIGSIARDNENVDKMNAITSSSCIKKAQAKAAARSYKEATNFESSTEDEIESSSDSASLSRTTPDLMVQFSYDEMKKFGLSHRDAIAGVVGGADKRVMDKKNLEDGLKFILEAKGKQSSGAITKDDLDEIGDVICGMKAADISRIEPEALEEYAGVIERCPLDAERRRTLANNIMDKLGLRDGANINVTNILSLGTSIAEMSDSQLDAIDQKVLCEMSDKIVQAFAEKEAEGENRMLEGFKMDVTESDEAKYRDNKKRVMTKLIAAATACASTGARRRRSTFSLTCAYIRNIGTSGLSALTVDQIKSVADAEFINCVDILGAVTDYSAEQKLALANVGKRGTVWGAVSTWTAATVYSAGVIVQGLNVSEVNALTVDLDAISRLGEFNGWSESHKSALFTRWLSLEKSNLANAITSSELRSLGHMTCGATTSHISAIPHSIYASAADAVGEVTSCSEEQLNAFMALAKSAYGNDVAVWDTTTISNVGIVIGGMTRSDIPRLSADQIGAIDSNHITYIPVSKFSAFTAAQLRMFSLSQAQSTTTAQRNALDSNQLASLSTAANIQFSPSSDGGTSSACGMNVSIVAMTLLMMAIAFLQH